MLVMRRHQRIDENRVSQRTFDCVPAKPSAVADIRPGAHHRMHFFFGAETMRVRYVGTCVWLNPAVIGFTMLSCSGEGLCAE